MKIPTKTSKIGNKELLAVVRRAFSAFRVESLETSYGVIVETRDFVANYKTISPCVRKVLAHSTFIHADASLFARDGSGARWCVMFDVRNQRRRERPFITKAYMLKVVKTRVLVDLEFMFSGGVEVAPGVFKLSARDGYTDTSLKFTIIGNHSDGFQLQIKFGNSTYTFVANYSKGLLENAWAHVFSKVHKYEKVK